MNTHIRPQFDHQLSSTMWEALRQGRLSLQHCEECSYIRFPASELCPECWSRDASWRDVETVGRIWSYTVYEQALHPMLKDAAPYTIALIELDSGPTLPGRLLCGPGSEITIGDRVTAVFTAIDSDFTMLEWVLEHPSQG